MQLGKFHPTFIGNFVFLLQNSGLDANNSMFDNYYPGETKNQRFGYNRTFNQPTVVVYKEAVINFSININIDNSTAKNVDKFLVRII